MGHVFVRMEPTGSTQNAGLYYHKLCANTPANYFQASLSAAKSQSSKVAKSPSVKEIGKWSETWGWRGECNGRGNEEEGYVEGYSSVKLLTMKHLELKEGGGRSVRSGEEGRLWVCLLLSPAKCHSWDWSFYPNETRSIVSVSCFRSNHLPCLCSDSGSCFHIHRMCSSFIDYWNGKLSGDSNMPAVASVGGWGGVVWVLGSFLPLWRQTVLLYWSIKPKIKSKTVARTQSKHFSMLRSQMLSTIISINSILLHQFCTGWIIKGRPAVRSVSCQTICRDLIAHWINFLRWC